MAGRKNANHEKPPRATNSKENNKSENHPEIEIAALDSILKNLSDLGIGSETDIQPEKSSFGTILNHLVEIVVILSKEISELKQQKQEEKEIKNQLRKCEDDLDESKQRQLKGNLILSCQKPKPGSPSIIKSDEQLGSSSISAHCIELVKQKYKVEIPEGDIQACHRLPNGSVLLKIWQRGPTSAWNRLLSGIKTGGNKEFKLFINFQMTTRRSSLMYEIRQLKKQGNLFKHGSDENGNIWIQAKESDPKKRVTQHYRQGEIYPTVTKDELMKLLEHKQ
ncbi:uncharacterized protein LOC111708689 [Eurytemora carolleeae]|jgi:hypothetical protein|uniref:uncharacterized protein LOC111708689 n=1 Tax=Eurytemora carolleeae TaxID=1294199 RepID=UPI000C774D92|nr:uncharacterized protein LOC111708689 [Eurytemora carolleeae]MCE2663223.1 hypothetical protein [Microcystis sp. 53602_E8]|eukprot:XP_023337903.1 uncharacterized protein LOC111708689 [Eurytemora affinis]